MRLPRAFYARPSEQVAPDLLGKVLVRSEEGATLRGRIVEVEAYAGERDPGSHAYRGPTARTRVMFGPPGHVYVYISYGMHYCMNLVTNTEGEAGAVLLRAVEPMEGIDTMCSRRGNKPLRELCNGPGKLCAAFGIDRRFNGADLEGREIWLEDDGHVAAGVATSARVGLSAGREACLRFYVAGNPFVSPGRPSA